MTIPDNCYECKFTSCYALPRWAGAKYFENYRNKRHKDCPFNAMEKKEPCWACKSLENGDTLYSMSDWDGGIGFDYIRDIKYCPVCGRKL